MIAKYLEDLVSFYPITSDQNSVLKLLQYVNKHFEKCGLNTKFHTINGVHSLYAGSHKSTHSSVLLQAHVDVVPTHIPAQKKITIQNDSLSGRGVYDMLFATACYMQFVDVNKELLEELNISLLLSGDEEFGGFNSVGELAETYSADICILPDAGHSLSEINSGAKGVYIAEVHIQGKSHHSSAPWDGDGAASKLIKFVSELEDIFNHSDKNNSTITISKLLAGDADNRGPSEAKVTFDIRFKDVDDLKYIQKQLQLLLKKYEGKITRSDYADDYELDINNEFVTKFTDIIEQHTKQKAIFKKGYGSSDARFFASKDIPVIMLRPEGGGLHSDHEWISRSSLDQFYKILEQYVLEVGKIEGNDD